MAVLLYARVSTREQAEHELSIPAQVRLMERYASEHSWQIADTFKDVASARLLKERPGLTALLHRVRHDRSITGVVVHKIDRFSRNTFNYLALKGKLLSSGVRIHSVVESLDPSPMGEFMEHIMAAQAEFYSANLAMEVRKGLEQALLKGRWTGPVTLGYLKVAGRVIRDPARAERMAEAFKLWGRGDITTVKLSETMYERGLVGRRGKKIKAKDWSRHLKNPFYRGLMQVNGATYQGVHSPLVSKEVFDRAQEVFKHKNGGTRRFRKHIFLLTGKVRCPNCASNLVGEQHVKKSGKVFRYYRCHKKACRYYIRTEKIEEEVFRQLTGMDLPKKWKESLTSTDPINRREVITQIVTNVRCGAEVVIGVRPLS